MNQQNPQPSFITLMMALLLGALLGMTSLASQANVFHDTELIKVIDGDTIHIHVKVWPSTIIDTKLRVYGIDTPEKHSKCLAERELAQKAKEFTTKMVSQGFSVGFGKDGKYAGRSIGTIHIPIKVIPKEFTTMEAVKTYVDKGIEPSLGDALIEAGLAVPYFGKKKKNWAKELCPEMFGIIPLKVITLPPLVITPETKG